MTAKELATDARAFMDRRLRTGKDDDIRGHIERLIDALEAMSVCTCYVTAESMWTVYGGAVEPGSQLEPNPDCPVHFPTPATP